MHLLIRMPVMTKHWLRDSEIDMSSLGLCDLRLLVRRLLGGRRRAASGFGGAGAACNVAARRDRAADRDEVHKRRWIRCSLVDRRPVVFQWCGSNRPDNISMLSVYLAKDFLRGEIAGVHGPPHRTIRFRGFTCP